MKEDDHIARLEAEIHNLRDALATAQAYARKKGEMMAALEEKYYALLAQNPLDKCREVPQDTGMKEGSYILVSDLQTVLVVATDAIGQIENLYDENYRSTLRVGLEANLAYLREHGRLEVRGQP